MLLRKALYLAHACSYRSGQAFNAVISKATQIVVGIFVAGCAEEPRTFEIIGTTARCQQFC